ncbi:putative reverse transcriptase domain-containing protein, partial [Tanacetum coccineum]
MLEILKVSEMKAEYFPPKEDVILQNEAPTDFYILVTGAVVLELIMKDGPRRGVHLNVNKTEVFWPRGDPRSRLAGVIPPTIARPLHGVKLLNGPVSVDFSFSSELVLKRVAKSIKLIDVASKLNDPQ